MVAGFKTADIETDRFQVAMLALGSPLLGERAKQFAHYNLLGNTAVAKAARNAALGNPIVHGEHDFPDHDPEEAIWFYKNSATFGNLSNPKIARRLKQILESPESLLVDGSREWPKV